MGDQPEPPTYWRDSMGHPIIPLEETRRLEALDRAIKIAGSYPIRNISSLLRTAEKLEDYVRTGNVPDPEKKESN